MGTSISPCLSASSASFSRSTSARAPARSLSSQGLTLVHFSAQPEPFLTEDIPQNPANIPLHPLKNPEMHPLSHRKRLR